MLLAGCITTARCEPPQRCCHRLVHHRSQLRQRQRQRQSCIPLHLQQPTCEATLLSMEGGGAAGGGPLGLRPGAQWLLGLLLMETPLGDTIKLAPELAGAGGGPPGKDCPG